MKNFLKLFDFPSKNKKKEKPQEVDTYFKEEKIKEIDFWEISYKLLEVFNKPEADDIIKVIEIENAKHIQNIEKYTDVFKSNINKHIKTILDKDRIIEFLKLCYNDLTLEKVEKMIVESITRTYYDNVIEFNNKLKYFEYDNHIKDKYAPFNEYQSYESFLCNSILSDVRISFTHSHSIRFDFDNYGNVLLEYLEKYATEIRKDKNNFVKNYDDIKKEINRFKTLYETHKSLNYIKVYTDKLEEVCRNLEYLREDVNKKEQHAQTKQLFDKIRNVDEEVQNITFLREELAKIKDEIKDEIANVVSVIMGKIESSKDEIVDTINRGNLFLDKELTKTRNEIKDKIESSKEEVVETVISSDVLLYEELSESNDEVKEIVVYSTSLITDEIQSSKEEVVETVISSDALLYEELSESNDEVKEMIVDSISLITDEIEVTEGGILKKVSSLEETIDKKTTAKRVKAKNPILTEEDKEREKIRGIENRFTQDLFYLLRKHNLLNFSEDETYENVLNILKELKYKVFIFKKGADAKRFFEIIFEGVINLTNYSFLTGFTVNTLSKSYKNDVLSEDFDVFLKDYENLKK